MAFGGHAGVDQDLGQGILGGRVDLPVIGGLGGMHEIEGVVVGDVLQGVGDGIDKILFLMMLISSSLVLVSRVGWSKGFHMSRASVGWCRAVSLSAR